MDWETVRRIALDLPNVEDGLSYGAPALKVGGQLMVRLREDLGAIVVRTTFDQREGLMAEEPEVYFITDHYREYPWVLVSLEHVKAEALREMVNIAYGLARTNKKAGTKAKGP
jgi:hypothetical protein